MAASRTAAKAVAKKAAAKKAPAKKAAASQPATKKTAAKRATPQSTKQVADTIHGTARIPHAAPVGRNQYSPPA